MLSTELDRLSDIRQRPLLSPRIVAEPIPTLYCVDAAGKALAFTLTDRTLAELQLSIALAIAERTLRRLGGQGII